MFVLRWRPSAHAAYRGEDDCFVYSQWQAKRYQTRAQAYSAVDHNLYYGAGGKDDRSGWKVVRLVRKR